MPAFCPACGSPLDSSSVTCGFCGTAVGAEAPPPAPPPDQPPPGPPVDAGPPPDDLPTAPPTTPAVAVPSGLPPSGPPASPPAADDRSRPPWLIPLLAGVAALALIATAFVVMGGDDDAIQAAGEVFLEPAGTPGPDPFTDSVATATAAPARLIRPTISPTPTPAPAESGSGSATPSTPPAGDAPVAIRGVNATAPGLYGGTRNAGSCDQEQMVTFLQQNPDKAAAWAAVQGITVDQLPAYIRSLTPVVLRGDTRVTNHGFRGGNPTPRQAVLQAGTAVLVDDLGIPRAKCNCGNPLLPPVASTAGVTYTGDPWPGFAPENVVVVSNPTNITIENIVLVDLANPGYFTRPPQTSGAQDGEILADSVCDLYPEICQEPVGGDVPDDAPVLGTGDVQITLRWFSIADLDLAVIGPDGERIDFGSPSSSSGGQLDVDSNSACSGDSTNPVENVFWPTGQALEGTYVIEVSLWGTCGASTPVAYELSILADGQPVAAFPAAAHPGDATIRFPVASGHEGTLTFAQQTASGALAAEGDTATYQFDKGPPGSWSPPSDAPATPPDADTPEPETPATTAAPDETTDEPTETLEEYCNRLYGPPPQYWHENMMYTVCMHDPVYDG